MNLIYKIDYTYDYKLNGVIITLTSDYMKKDFPVTNLQNLGAVLGHAIMEFNELHKPQIEELQAHEQIKKARAIIEKKPGSQKS